MAGQQARVDRIDRSLKRLGFRLIKTGRSFSIAGNANVIAVDSNPKSWRRSSSGLASTSSRKRA